MARTSGNQRFLVRDFGTCLQFDGTQDYVSLAQVSGIPLYNNTNLSVSMWFKTGNLAQADKRLYSEGNSSTNNDLYTFGVNNTGFRFLIRDHNNNIIYDQFGSTAFTKRRWYHVVFTDSNGVIKLYLDGVDITSTLSSASYTRGNLVIDRCCIGAVLRGTYSAEYTGKIDQVRLYKSTLTLAMVKDLYYRGVEVDATNLVGHYKFDEGSGNTATDSSGLGNTGTIVNATYSTDVFMKARTVAGSRMIPGKNYLPTPNMDIDDGTGKPTGWSHYDDAGGSTIVNTIDTSDFVSGSASHKLTISNATTTYKNNWTQINSYPLLPSPFVIGGSSFEVFYRYKNNAYSYCAIVLSGSGISDIAVLSTSTAHANWTEATVKVTLRKKVTSLNVQLQVKNTDTTHIAVLQIDEIRMYKSNRSAA